MESDTVYLPVEVAQTCQEVQDWIVQLLASNVEAVTEAKRVVSQRLSEDGDLTPAQRQTLELHINVLGAYQRTYDNMIGVLREF
jgi:hypothetical protein